MISAIGLIILAIIVIVLNIKARRPMTDEQTQALHDSIKDGW